MKITLEIVSENGKFKKVVSESEATKPEELGLGFAQSDKDAIALHLVCFAIGMSDIKKLFSLFNFNLKPNE